MAKTRAELKEEYKLMKIPAGVFQLRNLTDGCVFIGSTVNLPAMRNRLVLQLNTGGHSCRALQEAWTQLGEASFVYEVLTELRQNDADAAPTQEDVRELERMLREDLETSNRVDSKQDAARQSFKLYNPTMSRR